VDLHNCEVSGDPGASELKTLWRDPQFDPGQSAFYYVVSERAWSSPIWEDWGRKTGVRKIGVRVKIGLLRRLGSE